MRHGSIFSGGGGFDIAAEAMGWTNVFHCEIDPFCNRLLNYYWPEAYSFQDIKQFNATRFKGQIDILTGGFPCQPFSTAGKRKGTEDNRYLWPDMLRVIREIEPTWIVAENVYGLLSWNEGMVFEQVHIDLEALGYEIQTFVLPACGVNAPHRRYRVWFIACKRQLKHFKKKDATNANSTRLERWTKAGNAFQNRKKTFKQFARLSRRGFWKYWPTQPAICGRNDGLPNELDGITFSKWRRESIEMYGNAIVPQVALQIFKAIKHSSDFLGIE